MIRPYWLPRGIGNPDPWTPRSFSGEPRYRRPPRNRSISKQVTAETSAPAGPQAPPSSAPEPKSKYLPKAPRNKTAARTPLHRHTGRRGTSGVRISGFRGSLRGDRNFAEKPKIGQFPRRSPYKGAAPASQPESRDSGTPLHPNRPRKRAAGGEERGAAGLSIFPVSSPERPGIRTFGFPHFRFRQAARDM